MATKTDNRPADVGERILITDAKLTSGYYRNGDILTVVSTRPAGKYSEGSVRVDGRPGAIILTEEYEVIIEENKEEALI